MSGLYILDGKTPVLVEDTVEWSKRFNANDIHVARTIIQDVVVSTVFLGIDHNHFGGNPVLFETMIFGGEHDEYQERYSTWEEAEEGHHRACALVVS